MVFVVYFEENNMALYHYYVMGIKRGTTWNQRHARPTKVKSQESNFHCDKSLVSESFLYVLEWILFQNTPNAVIIMVKGPLRENLNQHF